VTGPPDQISQRYNTHAEELTERYLSLKIEDVFGDALEWLEVSPCRVLDVGAGPGRDAFWLSERGHTVVAVEPVEAFHRGLGPRVTYVADELPDLAQVTGPFDLILLNGVWHHVHPGDRVTALRRLSELLSGRGRIILSLRHGGTPDPGFAFAVDENEFCRLAESVGLKVEATTCKASVQSHNIRDDVRWTWVLLTAPLRHL